jgi:sugar-specific transcriptional regulator TrmB
VQKAHTCYAYGMLLSVSALRTYFVKLGLDNNIADLYLALYNKGPQSISALSRNSGIERTRIYRLIDKLLESSLIEVVPQQHGRGIIKAAPIANLRILINKREQELKNLTDELELMEQVIVQNSLSYANTRVQIFIGQEGTKQMLINELEKAQNTIYGCGSLNIFDPIIGSQFIQSYRHKLQDKKINQLFTNSLPSDSLYAWHICQDVVSYYHLEIGDTYGLEIHDQVIANIQRERYKLNDPER